MGETLYELFIAGYTEKQWGRDPAELSTEFAPKRVELRTDGYRGLFRDPYQGWPRRGYTALVEALVSDVPVVLCEAVTAANIGAFVPPGVPVVLTCPLDDFYEGTEGELEWRGVRLVPQWIPDEALVLDAMVVNEPDRNVPYTRAVETKHVFPELAERAGTVVCHEYPGAPVKHYPVYDAEGRNRAVQARYESRLRRETRNLYVPAGRLARYSYINMDEAMRQGLDAAKEVARSVRR
jgi:UDP-galactopyranose mutase